MKSDNIMIFLALPVVATLLNFILFLAFFQSHPVQAQEQPVVAHRYEDLLLLDGQDNDSTSILQCLNGVCEQSDSVWNDSYLQDKEPLSSTATSNTENDSFEKDPRLQMIPGTNFEAYVRADVATFYQQPEGSRKEQKPAFRGQAGKFINISPEPVDLYWVGNDGNFVIIDSHIGAWQSGGTSTFPGHVFVFTEHGTHRVKKRFHVLPGTSVYHYDPFTQSTETESSRSLLELSTEDLEQYKAHRDNLNFARLYRNFTGGSEWLAMYPKDPPSHHIWRADYFGQEHSVFSKETQFIDTPPSSELRALTSEDYQRNETDAVPLQDFRLPGFMEIKIKAASCAPRVFTIDNFLSDLEVDHLINLIQDMNLERSTTGGHMSDTRTSTTTWLRRDTDPIVDSIYRRISDALRIDEALLRRRLPEERPDIPFLQQINEELQVVHYGKGQEYTAHHDFGYPKESPASRSINFCMYLNNVEAGGQTSFPRWRNAETNRGLDVTPKKGSAVIFYMVNPDGNLDDLTQHAALPVIEGEKYFTNLWIWDPIRSGIL